MSSGGFAARAQSAGDRNTNAAGSGGSMVGNNSGGSGGGSGQNASGGKGNSK